MSMNEPNMTDYELTRREFRLKVPEYFNFGFDVVDDWAKREPDKLALLAVDDRGDSAKRITFAEISEASNRFANVLKKMGLKKGQRVLVMLPRIPEWYPVMVGMIKLGVVPIPTTAQCTPKDIDYRLKQSGAPMVITDGENAAKVDEVKGRHRGLKRLLMVRGEQGGEWLSYESEVARASDRLDGAEPTRSDDPLLLYFTSGTVSYPKMVLHTQASCGIGHVVTARFWHDLKPADLHWTVSDMGWAKAGWGKIFGQWTVGAALFLHDARGKLDPKRMLKLLESYDITSFCAAPTAYRVMVLEDLKQYRFPRLRHCTAAGEPLNPEVIFQWEKGTGLNIYDGYGQSETVNVVANYRCLPIKPGSMGKPAPGFDVGVIDDEGREMPPGKEGHIAIRVKPNRPVGLLKEYWKNPRKTAEAFRGDWYYTGDKAYRDDDGYFWFIGRADDVIISSGYRIGPFEVESALIEHPAVAEAAVVASPDDLRGEVVKAFVILAPGYSGSEDLKKELQEHVKRVTAPYKYPRKIDFVTDVPRTVSGKIKRAELKRQEWEGWKRK